MTNIGKNTRLTIALDRSPLFEKKRTVKWLVIANILLSACMKNEINTSNQLPEVEGMFSSDLAKQPNILLIAIDDLRPDIGAYGHPTAKTPNLDNFSRTAITFKNAITQQAVCAPSRAALMTGLRPDTTTITSLKQPLDKAAPDVVSMADYFKANGYETLSVGKIYHHKDDDADGWSKPPFNSVYDIRKRRREAGEPNVSYKREDNIENLPDRQNLIHAKRELLRLSKSEKPFFLAYGLQKPHLPFIAPNEFWDLYSKDDVPEPVTRQAQKNAPDWALVSWEIWNYSDTPDGGGKFKTLMPEGKADDLRHGYLAAVSYADDIIGQILAEVEQLNLDEDTIIVIWGDHGFKLGDYNAWAKHSTVEMDIRIPLMIRVPGVITRGGVSKAMVETVDIYPTMVELMGNTPSKDIEGLSFVPLLTNPQATWKSAAFSQYLRNGTEFGTLDGRTVRTQDYRYTAWVNKKTGNVLNQELYDHRNDPHELNNVAKISGYEAILEAHELFRQAGWEAVRATVTEK